MRRGRLRWRYGLVGVGLVLALAAVSSVPSLLRSLSSSRLHTAIANLATTPVVRTDLTTLMTASGRVDSTERTYIECRLERLDAGLRGNGISAGGASTILSILPEGSEVKKGDVLCVLDSSAYEEILIQQTMTVDRSLADHLSAEINLDVTKLALQEYRDGLQVQNREEMKGKIALASSEQRRAKERLEWSRRMFGKGYFAEGTVKSEEFALEKTSKQLADDEESLRMFDKYFAPKYLHILESEILGAEAIMKFQDARLSRNQERLERIKQQVERCQIRAPHDGFLIYANDPRLGIVIEEGRVVWERQKLFYLPDLTHMEVEAMLHESVVHEVKPGMPAKVQIEGIPERILEGHVTSIAPLPSKPDFFTDVNYFIGIVKLDVIPRGLKPGMTAEVSIRTMQRPSVLAIPLDALTVERGKEVCYVAAEDHVERREVKVGQHTGELLEVMEGLSEGDEVVRDPTSTDVAELAHAEHGEPIVAP